MPNMKGGKKYKSGSHATEEAELYEINEHEVQSIGRVLKHLGDRNVLLYCNDNKERIAHIRGGLSKKKANIDKGDIVLYSNRGDGIGSKNSDNRADILQKYSREIHRELKKKPGVNPRLFLQLERVDSASGIPEDDGVDFEANSEDEDSEEQNQERAAKKQQEDVKRNTARDSKYNVESDKDVDIDKL